MKDQIPDLAQMPELPALREAQQALERCQGELTRALADNASMRAELQAIDAMKHRTRPAEPAPGPIVITSAARGGAKQRGLILVADDNADAGWGLAKLLEIAGFATLRVGGGVDAVQETRRQKPDVGILDIGMPDLSGHEAARQIRQTDWGKRMVLIAATGWGQESDEREAIEAGFDVHMTKPVDLRKLSAVVEELLARKRS